MHKIKNTFKNILFKFFKYLKKNIQNFCWNCFEGLLNLILQTFLKLVLTFSSGSFFLILIGLNILIESVLIFFFKNRIDIKFNYWNTSLLSMIILLIIIFIIIIIKFLKEKYKARVDRLIFLFTSIIMFFFFWINLFYAQLIAMRFRSLEDMLVNNKFLSIKFCYSKDELMGMIPIFYKQLTAHIRIFTKDEQLIILKDASTAQQIKINLKQFLEEEAIIKYSSLVDIFANSPLYPYVMVGGMIIVSIFFSSNFTTLLRGHGIDLFHGL